MDALLAELLPTAPEPECIARVASVSLSSSASPVWTAVLKLSGQADVWGPAIQDFRTVVHSLADSKVTQSLLSLQ